MSDINAFEALDIFHTRWALVAAGTIGHFNACTIGWGSLGTVWGRRAVTVYVHPSRYTAGFLRSNDLFTVSFYPEECRKALTVMGTLSGRDGDKARAAGLTPVSYGGSVTFREAETTLLCRKLYQHRFSPEDLAPEILQYYAARPKVFPPDENGMAQPHWVFVGEVIEPADSATVGGRA